jgi:hypothetical protein
MLVFLLSSVFIRQRGEKHRDCRLDTPFGEIMKDNGVELIAHQTQFYEGMKVRWDLVTT